MTYSNSSGADEFAQLVAIHEARLFAYIYALTLNMADAEDIYQDTLLVLWRKYKDYQPNTNFAAWARAAARRELQHYFRRKGRQRVHFDEKLLEELSETQSCLDEARDASSDMYLQALLQCKEKLSEGDRRLIELCYASGLNITQAAQQLGRSPQSVCNSLSRIRRALFDCIQKFLEREPHDG